MSNMNNDPITNYDKMNSLEKNLRSSFRASPDLFGGVSKQYLDILTKASLLEIESLKKSNQQADFQIKQDKQNYDKYNLYLNKVQNSQELTLDECKDASKTLDKILLSLNRTSSDEKSILSSLNVNMDRIASNESTTFERSEMKNLFMSIQSSLNENNMTNRSILDTLDMPDGISGKNDVNSTSNKDKSPMDSSFLNKVIGGAALTYLALGLDQNKKTQPLVRGTAYALPAAGKLLSTAGAYAVKTLEPISAIFAKLNPTIISKGLNSLGSSGLMLAEGATKFSKMLGPFGIALTALLTVKDLVLGISEQFFGTDSDKKSTAEKVAGVTKKVVAGALSPFGMSEDFLSMIGKGTGERMSAFKENTSSLFSNIFEKGSEAGNPNGTGETAAYEGVNLAKANKFANISAEQEVVDSSHNKQGFKAKDNKNYDILHSCLANVALAMQKVDPKLYNEMGNMNRAREFNSWVKTNKYAQSQIKQIMPDASKKNSGLLPGDIIVDTSTSAAGHIEVIDSKYNANSYFQDPKAQSAVRKIKEGKAKNGIISVYRFKGNDSYTPQETNNKNLTPNSISKEQIIDAAYKGISKNELGSTSPTEMIKDPKYAGYNFGHSQFNSGNEKAWKSIGFNDKEIKSIHSGDFSKLSKKDINARLKSKSKEIDELDKKHMLELYNQVKGYGAKGGIFEKLDISDPEVIAQLMDITNQYDPSNTFGPDTAGKLQEYSGGKKVTPEAFLKWRRQTAYGKASIDEHKNDKEKNTDDGFRRYLNVKTETARFKMQAALPTTKNSFGKFAEEALKNGDTQFKSNKQEKVAYMPPQEQSAPTGNSGSSGGTTVRKSVDNNNLILIGMGYLT